MQGVEDSPGHHESAGVANLAERRGSSRSLNIPVALRCFDRDI